MTRPRSASISSSTVFPPSFFPLFLSFFIFRRKIAVPRSRPRIRPIRLKVRRRRRAELGVLGRRLVVLLLLRRRRRRVRDPRVARGVVGRVERVARRDRRHDVVRSSGLSLLLQRGDVRRRPCVRGHPRLLRLRVMRMSMSVGVGVLAMLRVAAVARYDDRVEARRRRVARDVLRGCVDHLRGQLPVEVRVVVRLGDAARVHAGGGEVAARVRRRAGVFFAFLGFPPAVAEEEEYGGADQCQSGEPADHAASYGAGPILP